MKYICALLSVRDIHAAKAFYQELFGREDMGMVIRRFLASGMTMEEVSVKMGASIGDLTKLLNTVPSSEKG